MRMNQDERRFDFHGLGAALKRAREEKGWTQAYVAELVDRDSRTIMNIENKGQYPSFDLFVKLSRLDAPRARTPSRRPHRPAAPGRYLPLSATLEAPG